MGIITQIWVPPGLDFETWESANLLSIHTINPYTSSIETRRPTIAAARCKLDSVMSFFGSRSRSTCVRLVLSNVAILFLEIFCCFIASANCHATTS